MRQIYKKNWSSINIFEGKLMVYRIVDNYFLHLKSHFRLKSNQIAANGASVGVNGASVGDKIGQGSLHFEGSI